VSEYQYYEFVAIDQPLTSAQMAELRARSTRATITPASFVNTYHWGGLKGDPTDWMRCYFDAFVYVANWCSCRFALRFPRAAFALEELSGFMTGGALTLEKSPGHWIIEWGLSESEDYDRFGSEQGEGWMGRLAAVRDELLRGDRRALYLGWLAGVAAGEVDEDCLEPEIPLGLSRLTAAQRSLAEFIEVDADLLAAAAMESPGMDDESGDAEAEMDEWLENVAIDEARAILKSLLKGQPQQVERQLRLRFLAWRKARLPQAERSEQRRSVAELRKKAEIAREARLRRAEEDLAQLEAERRRRREAHLAALAEDFDGCWSKIDQTAAQGIASAYQEATQALADLSEAYERHASRAEFDARFRGFAEQHGRRRALVQRLKSAGLWQ
jgi:hypothetical protein